MFAAGPASAVRAMPHLGFLKLRGSVETGFAQPTPAKIMQRVPTRSKWRNGFRLMRPSRFAVEGGTARIRVYGIPDFDYADVKLDQKANLDCSLVKLSPLVAGASDTQPPNRQSVNPRVWFETRGRAVLEALVTDLNSRGHSSLTVQENGEVFVQAKENEAEPAKETFLDFPEKVYWPQLVKVLEEEGYAADARDADILVSW